MPNIIIAGAQWGDEGKGKIVDLLAERVQVVARYNGGHNAGHTVIVGDRRFILHLIPSGILHDGVLCLMGNGMVIDPWALEREIAELREAGITIDGNLRISDRAHLILPHHREIETLTEELRGARSIGTTLRGIGPAYEDKIGRRGLRMGDLVRPAALADKLTEARRHYELILRGAGREPMIDWDALVKDLAGFGDRLGSRITDVARTLHVEMARGYSALFEGAQATMLDVDFGSYPYVTSSSAIAAGAATGLGVPLTRIDAIVGILKAYTTRVGGGPFPTTMGGELEEEIRRQGGEFGASTGRPRRCGWFDAVIARHAVRVNGFDFLALMKLDVLDALAEIRICTAYRCEGETLDEMPADPALFERCEPVYENIPGWQSATVGIRKYADLPEAARRYIERISELIGAEIGIISTGPDRSQTIVREQFSLASWFAG
ncbi:MAG: adenylosuccinate synthase [Vicinamibacteria bacterium]|nr:adenylosuccinate synthase [Vicinamibacteria bacterium]